MSDADDEGFAKRWSRLKQEAREGKPSEEAPPPVPQRVHEASATLPAAGGQNSEKREEKPFDPASLPPVESLTGKSDYSVFMRAEVPEGLRQKALRQLWATDPVLSAPDLFDMHNLDYNAVPTFPEGVKTLYRVGRGMLDEVEEEAERKAAEDAARQDASPADSAEPRTVQDSDEGGAEEQSRDVAAQHAAESENTDSGPNKA